MITCARAQACTGSRYPFLTIKERDIETALDYFKARYYSATQGRFLSTDPMMKPANIGDPQSFNRYTYALNSPVTIDDPDGMCPKGKKCYKDEKGFEYYDDVDGNQVAVTETWSSRNGNPVVFSVIVTVPQDFQIVYRSTRVWSVAPRTVPPTRGLGSFGKLFGALGIILFSPSSTGCGASPGMVSDGNGGCMRMTAEDEPDTSANPDPEDNKPDTSENQTETTDAKDAADPGGDVKKLSRNEVDTLKNHGIDIHELKGGKGASRFDLYKDSNGNIYIKRKGGGGEADPTGYNIKDFQ